MQCKTPAENGGCFLGKLTVAKSAALCIWGERAALMQRGAPGWVRRLFIGCYSKTSPYFRLIS
ncbi:MAG: hypothetical protein RRY53_06250, partial [Pseudoflavonifractor sp.]